MNLWLRTHALLPMGEGEVSLPDLLTWAKLEPVSLREWILCAVPVCLLPPCAPQRWSVWQGCGNQEKTVWLGQPLGGWETASFLLQSLWWGSGNAGAWLVARLSMRSLALLTAAGKCSAGAGSGPRPLFPAPWGEGVGPSQQWWH